MSRWRPPVANTDASHEDAYEAHKRQAAAADEKFCQWCWEQHLDPEDTQSMIEYEDLFYEGEGELQ